MTTFSTEATTVIAKRKLASDPSTVDFQVKVRGQILKGFVVRKGKSFYAYHNLCKHLPVTLDLNDNSFFNHDRSLLQCQMHGALYQMESGLCVGGPCEGARLTSLPLEERETELIIHFPEELVAEEVSLG